MAAEPAPTAAVTAIGSPAPEPSVVEIKVRESGPYKITGPVRLVDADGNAYELPTDGRAIALCRCGQSAEKPFCDGTHRECGFDAAERVAPTE